MALHDVSLALETNQVGCLVGPNGAGKTTLVEIILGLREADAGEVWLLGHEVRGRLPSSLAKRVGAMLEEAHLHPWIPVERSLAMIAELYGVSLPEPRLTALLRDVGLDRGLARQAYTRLSYGQRRKADLAAALVTDPEILFLDDPFLGLDPLARMDVLDTLRRLSADRTLFYTTHLLDVATRFADQVLILLRGQLRAAAPPEVLIRQYGGMWRIRAWLRDEHVPQGFEKVAPSEVCALASTFPELIRYLQTLADHPSVGDVVIDPPTLQQVFEYLAQEEKSCAPDLESAQD